jgi:flagellar basal body-associated protein FliL
LFGRHRRKKLKKRAIKVLIASAVFVLLVVVAYMIVKMTLSEGRSPVPIFSSE